MKIKIKLYTPILLLIILSFSIKVSAQSTVTCTAVGYGSCVAPNIASQTTSDKIKSRLDDVKENTKGTKENTKTTIDKLQTIIDNYNNSLKAQKLTAEKLKTAGSIVAKNLEGPKKTSVNPMTNGSQVVTDLSGYISNNGENAVRTVLENQATDSSSNPYLSDASKTTVQNLRTSSNDQITVQLPYVAQNEICNDPKLKDVIKNGEPSNWVKPKPALKNVDMNKLCNADLATDKNSQAALIAVAEAGYGGTRTGIALSDPANTPSAVQQQLQQQIDKKSAAAEADATNQYLSNGGVIGNQTCLDKNGKVKNIDATNPNNSYCDKIVNASIADTGSSIRSQLDAASNSGYYALSSMADVPANDSPTNTSSSDTSSSATAANDPTDVSFSGILDSILQKGDGALEDYAYTKYASYTDSLTKIENQAAALNDQYNNTNLFNNIIDGVSPDLNKVPDMITVYKDLRSINIEKLNTEVYTYALVETALGFEKVHTDSLKAQAAAIIVKQLANSMIVGISPTSILSSVQSGSIPSGSIPKALQDEIDNGNNTIKGFDTAKNNLGNEIKDLIKQMSLNNYKEQQLNKVEGFVKNNSSSTDINNFLTQTLTGTLTQNDADKISSDWSNAPTSLDPNTDESSSAYFIPSKEIIISPFSQDTLTNLRLKAYKLTEKYNSEDPCTVYKKYLGQKMFNSESCGNLSGLFDNFGISNLANFFPDLPRGNYTNLIDVNDSINYTASDFCKKTGINICK
ncbi:MAG: hypothetical protein WCO35_03610 [Candidatus Nomurabacteria bacterium]